MRADWDIYFIRIAGEVASRGTCNRKKVGAVITRDNRILSTGYNGAVSGADHCDQVGHAMRDNHCVRTVHAELNAVAQAAKYGVEIGNSTIYITTYPCLACFHVCVNAGIKKFVYRDDYNNDRLIRDEASSLGLSVVRVAEEGPIPGDVVGMPNP